MDINEEDMDKVFDEEIEILEDENNKDIEIEESNDTKIEGNNTSNTEEEKPKPKQKPDRAQKRIQQLIEQRKEMENILAKQEEAINLLKERLEQVESKTSSSAKQDKENLKASYDSQISVLKKQMAQAIQDGDADKVVDTQDTLTKLQMKLAAINYELSNSHNQNNNNSNNQNNNQPVKDTNNPRSGKIPQKALDWVEAHPEFKKDQVFYAASLITNNQLLEEGFDPNEDDFYEELDTRLSKRFPEFYETEEEDLNMSKDEHNKPKRPIQRTAQTPSREVSFSKTKSDPSKVTLTEADLHQIERFGLDKKDFARRKAIFERHSSNKDSFGGYVPI